MALPLVAMGAGCAALAAWSYRQDNHGPPAEHENPAELKFALLFVILYAVILLAAAAAREWFGTRGLYVVAALSGLTDMDAITLSTAQLVEWPGRRRGRLAGDPACVAGQLRLQGRAGGRAE
jgi:uncharacterized membrane protein (DUF4010 family)